MKNHSKKVYLHIFLPEYNKDTKEFSSVRSYFYLVVFNVYVHAHGKRV